MRALLVEDDPDIHEQLLVRLKNEGFVVDSCTDGAEAIEFGLENDYSVVLLDCGLPLFSGEQVIKRWKDRGRTFPIIVITGTRKMRDDVHDLIKLGVDLLFQKPIIDYDQLMTWVKTRANSSRPLVHGTVIQHGSLVMDTEQATVRLSGKLCRVSPAEFTILRALLLEQGRPLTARQIAGKCAFPDRNDDLKPVNEESVPMHIKHIRGKLGDQVVRTVGGGRGYAIA